MDSTPSGAGGPSTGSRWGCALALVAASLVAFQPIVANDFITFDDDIYVTRNPFVQAGLTRDGARWAFTPDGSGVHYWHPLTWLSLMADVEAFGASPQAIHSVNLALHAIAGLLLYLLLLRATRRPWPSVAAALLFLVHPLQVESVAWAVERKTVLSTVLGLAALHAYLWYAARPRAARMALVLGIFTASLLAKPSLVTLPFLMLLLDAWPLGRLPGLAGAAGEPPPQRGAWARLVVEKLPLFGVALAVGLLVGRTAGLGHDTTPLGLRASTALANVGVYLGRVAWPANLGVFYPQPPAIRLASVALGGALLVLVTGILAARWRRSPGPLLGWLWFLGTLMPASGLVRGGLWPASADRFVYFPLAGLAVAIAWGVADLVQARRAWSSAAVVALAVAATLLAARTRVQVGYWRDSETLFARTEAVTGENEVALIQMGRALEGRGRVEDATALYERVLRKNPSNAYALVNLGAVLTGRGDLEAADRLFARAVQAEPNHPQALYNHALAVQRRQGPLAALPWLERAVSAGMANSTAVNQLAGAYRVAGRWPEAERNYRRALGGDPRHWHAGVNLARLLRDQGRLREAVAAAAEAQRRARLQGADTSVADALLRELAAAVR